MVKKMDPVIVVGGGWAGLAAAVELTRYEIPVTLLESAKQLGGRARRVQFSNTTKQHSIDNGQHLLIGAYDSTLSMLRTLGIQEEKVLHRKNMYLRMYSPITRNLHLRTGGLPTPLHLALGLLTATGLSLFDRIKALRFSAALAKSDYTLEKDETCLSLLQRHKQSKKLIKNIWEPLCLAALNTHIHGASAVIFLRVLRETFF